MKKLFFWILFIAIVFFLSMQFSEKIQSKVLYLNEGIKVGILNLNNNIINAITRHFDQASQIKHLTNELKDKEGLQYQLEATLKQYQEILDSVDADLLPKVPNFYLMRTISYVMINDYTRIWLEADKKEELKDKQKQIFGLISNNQVAGISMLQEGRFVGHLNGSEKCSYSVVVGEDNAPGVTKYDASMGFIVDYIPLYSKINVADKIYTSGYDGIFYPGIFVGSVKKIEKRGGHQIAIIELALKRASQFYWLVDINSSK